MKRDLRVGQGDQRIGIAAVEPLDPAAALLAHRVLALFRAACVALEFPGVHRPILSRLDVDLDHPLDVIVRGRPRKRGLLVPALMALLDGWNWWSPAPLRRLHARLNVSDEPRPPAVGGRGRPSYGVGPTGPTRISSTSP